MKTVKNISGQDLSIPNVGFIQADGIVNVADDFHNANFEEVKESKTELKTDFKDDKKLKTNK